jgi:DNA end-binding protein Ku
MPRAMWRGAIQFGLVTIPVKLYLATESRGGLSFNLLHAECLNRIQMKTHCPVHGEISRADTVRGFEWSKGQYVVIEEGDLENVPLKTVRAIEIELFVDAQRDSHGVNFVKQAYYIEPEPVGRKAFYLLKQVLADEGLQAICKIVLKDREALAALSPYSKTMLLSTLYWPDEVRAIDELELPEEQYEFKPAERAMAEQLVATMKGEFKAEDYHDEYRQALLDVIESKVDGQPAARPEPVVAATKLTDLMAVLEASVAAARASKTGPTAASDVGAAAKPAAARSRAKAAEPPAEIASARSSRAATGTAKRTSKATAATSTDGAATPAAASATGRKPATATERKRKTA